MRDFISVMKALSEPNRVRIIKLLGKRPLCVCEMTSLLGLAQPTISKHVRVLEHAGLVCGRREGPWVLYDLDTEGSEYSRTMIEKLTDWLDHDPQLQDLYERLKTVDRRELCNMSQEKRTEIIPS